MSFFLCLLLCLNPLPEPSPSDTRTRPKNTYKKKIELPRRRRARPGLRNECWETCWRPRTSTVRRTIQLGPAGGAAPELRNPLGRNLGLFHVQPEELPRGLELAAWTPQDAALADRHPGSGQRHYI